MPTSDRYEFFLNENERTERIRENLSVISDLSAKRDEIDYCLVVMRSDKPHTSMAIVLPNEKIVDEFGKRVFDFDSSTGYLTFVHHESMLAHKIFGGGVDVEPEALGLYAAHRNPWFPDNADLIRTVAFVDNSKMFPVYVPIRKRFGFLPVTRGAMSRHVKLALKTFLTGHIETTGELSLITCDGGTEIDKPRDKKNDETIYQCDKWGEKRRDDQRCTKRCDKLEG